VCNYNCQNVEIVVTVTAVETLIVFSGEPGRDGSPGRPGGDSTGRKGDQGLPGDRGLDGRPGVKGAGGNVFGLFTTLPYRMCAFTPVKC